MKNKSLVQKDTPNFSIKDIQIGVTDSEFIKGMTLYENDKVKNIESAFGGCIATVSGTHEYNVYVSFSAFDIGNCDCYIGMRDELCKHMIALAINLVYRYNPNDTERIMQPLDQAVCSGEIRDISRAELEQVKEGIKQALIFIKGYSGSSSKWFEYQDSLNKASRLTLLALSKIPICEKSVDICIDILKKIDKKLSLSGVDDSNGIVGRLMEQIIELLCMYTTNNKSLGKYIAENLPEGNIFDWGSGFFVFNPELEIYRTKR